MSQFFASSGQSIGVSACLLRARYCVSNDGVGILSPLPRMHSPQVGGGRGDRVSHGISCLPQHIGNQRRAGGSALISQNLPPSPALVAGPSSRGAARRQVPNTRKCLEPLGPKASSASFMLWFALLEMVFIAPCFPIHVSSSGFTGMLCYCFKLVSGVRFIRDAPGATSPESTKCRGCLTGLKPLLECV